VTLSKIHHLSTLYIRTGNEDEELQLETLSSNHLKKLILKGRLSEGTLKSPFFSTNGDALHEISLVWSQLAENPVPCLSEFSNLTKICLLKAYTGQELNFQPEWFPNVKTITLCDLPHVNKMCIHEGALVRLELLQIRDLVELQDIPTGLEYLKSLKEVLFSDMHNDFKSKFQAVNLERIPIVFC
jgi:disease resistance protein RPM1